MDEKKKKTTLQKELLKIEKQETKMRQTALKAKPFGWKSELEKKIPDKVYKGLESAFCKAFAVVFKQGRALIEKGVDQEGIRADHMIQEYAIQVKGGKREIKQMRKSAGQSSLLNMAVTTVEGMGLGLLGVGLPDIVLFIGTVLKGIYETALHYGFEYDTKEEQYYILKLMAASLSHGEEWVRWNQEADVWNDCETAQVITEEILKEQIRETAAVFAMDMLVLKFIQGLPVVGVVGGAANPVYYRKVMKYVQMKYQKRYLQKMLNM